MECLPLPPSPGFSLIELAYAFTTVSTSTGSFKWVTLAALTATIYRFVAKLLVKRRSAVAASWLLEGWFLASPSSNMRSSFYQRAAHGLML